jgi:energy-coupling factor transporter ATP-binding protein EcfA2
VALIITIVAAYTLDAINKLSLPLKLQITIYVGIVIIVASWLTHVGFFELIKFSKPNALDVVVIITLLTSIGCELCWISFENGNCSKYTLAIVVISIGFSIIRVAQSGNNNPIKGNGNVVDLKDIYEGRIDNNMTGPLLMTEKDVDYDLLNRNMLIMQLYSSVVTCKSNQSFVIGIEGEWGCGKTTIINNLKRIIQDSNSEEIIIIDDFDPWIFGTQDAMLTAMFDTILSHIGIGYSITNNRKELESIVNTALGAVQTKGIINHSSFVKSGSYKKTILIKERIADFLRESTKTFVFIIDNIDRIEADNVILLFKLLGTFFDLPNIVYVLSYDEVRLQRIFSDEKKIDPKYIEKIIQQVVKVPPIQKEQLNEVYSVCIENILKYYNVNNEYIQEYQSVFKLICSNVKNLRSFKRLVNSAFLNTFFINKHINKPNLLSLETIRFLEPELYERIWDNRKFFISHDKIVDEELYTLSFYKDKFNTEGNTFFTDLFKEYYQYKAVLADMFPYVDRFCKGQPLESQGFFYDENESKKISINRSICSGKYFELYFSYGGNEFVLIGDDVEKAVNSILSVKDTDAVSEIFHDAVTAIDNDQHKEWFERFQNYLDVIPINLRSALATAILDNIIYIDDSTAFLVLSARSRAGLIIEQLLEGTTINEITEFANNLDEKYDKLNIISNIIYWFEKTQSNNGEIQEKAAIIKNIYIIMCDEVINDKINLYDTKYYSRHNIWGLIRTIPKEKRNTILKQYLEDVFPKSNVYRILGDVINTSMVLCQVFGQDF